MDLSLFSLCFFHHDKDDHVKWSKHQAHIMDGIVIGCSPTLNALLVYNPRNKQYYEPDSYRIDSYRLPTSVYPDVKYNGGLFCLLLWDNNPPMEEKNPWHSHQTYQSFHEYTCLGNGDGHSRVWILWIPWVTTATPFSLIIV